MDDRTAAAFQQGRALEFERALAEAQARELKHREAFDTWALHDCPAPEVCPCCLEATRFFGPDGLPDSTALRAFGVRVAAEALRHCSDEMPDCVGIAESVLGGHK
jgi:hypothetical protein